MSTASPRKLLAIFGAVIGVLILLCLWQALG